MGGGGGSAGRGGFGTCPLCGGGRLGGSGEGVGRGGPRGRGLPWAVGGSWGGIGAYVVAMRGSVGAGGAEQEAGGAAEAAGEPCSGMVGEADAARDGDLHVVPCAEGVGQDAARRETELGGFNDALARDRVVRDGLRGERRLEDVAGRWRPRGRGGERAGRHNGV